jgi:hypothetical protein
MQFWLAIYDFPQDVYLKRDQLFRCYTVWGQRKDIMIIPVLAFLATVGKRSYLTPVVLSLTGNIRE